MNGTRYGTGTPDQELLLSVDPNVVRNLSLRAGKFASNSIAKRQKSGIKPFSLDSALSSVYNNIRRAEHYIPIYRLAVKTTGLGDLLSPFLPAGALRWKFSGEEIVDASSKKWLEGFSGLRDRILTAHAGSLQPTELDNLVKDRGFQFRKTGRVFGEIFAPASGNKAERVLLRNVFLMETGQVSGSSVASIWQAGSRRINVLSGLSGESVNWLNEKLFSGKLSPIWQERIAKFGGIAKGIGGGLLGNYVGAMNRFLKEPVPILDRILSMEGEVEHKASSLLDELFGKKVGVDKWITKETISYGKLPNFLRPYVSSNYWTATKPRMLAGLIGKGVLFTHLIPAAYSALDYSRRQLSSPSDKFLSVPLFAGVGLGVGALIHSKPVSFLSKSRITRTQFGGALIGAAVGLLPAFDKGITAGAANLFGRFHLGASKLWNVIGGQKVVEQQEGLLPGITSPWTAVGFALTGGFRGWMATEAGTVRGFVDRYRIRSLISKGTPLDDPKLKKLLDREAIGYSATIRESQRILGGEDITPSTPTGVKAKQYRELLAQRERLGEVQAISERLELSGRIYDRTQAEIKESIQVETAKRLEGEGPLSRFKTKVKGALFAKRPGFFRGAARGLALYGAISELGAIASGVMGGNFSPTALIPGWLIRLTGGGARPDELQEIYSGEKEVAVRKGRWWLMGRCNASNALIRIGKCSYKLAKDITGKDSLIGSDGEAHPLSRIWVRYYKGEMLSITSVIDYNNPTKVTPNHIIPVLRKLDCHNQYITKNERQVEFIRADLVQPGDYVQVPTPSLPVDQLNLDILSLPLILHTLSIGDLVVSAQKNWFNGLLQKAPRAISLPRFLNVDKEFAYFLGVFVAEGSLSFNGGHKRLPSVIETAHHQEDEGIYKRLTAFYRSLGIGTTIQFGENSKAVRLRACNTLLSSIVFSIIYNNQKGSCLLKRIPDCILSAPLEVKQSFVQGWFDGDGCYDGKTNVISSCNYELLKQLQLLLLSISQFASISKIEIQEKIFFPQGFSPKQYFRWKIRYNGCEGYLWREGKLYVRVKTVSKYKYEDFVYDFKIEHQDHLLQNGAFLVHNSPIEGGKIEYFRPHQVALLQSDARDTALYGSTEEKMAFEPIFHPIRTLMGDEEFLYHREKRMMYEAPSPLTSGLFTEVPLVGNFLSATLGEAIKPTVAIRPEEWLFPNSFPGAPAMVPPPEHWGGTGEGGRLPPTPLLGSPILYSAADPNSLGVMGRQGMKQFQEMAGLSGFLLGQVIGPARSYDPVIETSSRLFSRGGRFWEMNIGDPGISEALRRFLPKDRTSYYNPLKNLSPSWLPGDGYFRNFGRGSFYSAINEGWARLPGRGYEVLHPELEGLNPEDYPTAWKYKILSDVGYGSPQWKFTKEQVLAQIQTGQISAEDRRLITETNQQLKQKEKEKGFRDYRFSKEVLKPVKVHVTSLLEDGSFTVAEFGNRVMSVGGVNLSMAGLSRELLRTQAVKTQQQAIAQAKNKKAQIMDFLRGHIYEGAELDIYVHRDEVEQWKSSTTAAYVPKVSEALIKMGAEVEDNSFAREAQYNKAQQFIGKLWEQGTRVFPKIAITPASVMDQGFVTQSMYKYITRLSPIEHYASSHVYGREIQLWERQWEDFWRRAIYEERAAITGDFIPREVQFRRTLQDYFDKLTYLKYFALESSARKEGNEEAADVWAKKKRRTLFGVDPYKGFSDIWGAMPRSERDYYREFVDAETPEEREKILTLVPHSMKKIYSAQWQEKEIRALTNKMEAGQISREEKNKLYAYYNLRHVEGMEWSPGEEQEYQRTAPKDVSYADWKRLKELEEYFSSFKLPDKNWVGWNPSVDMRDVEMKFVTDVIKGDIHDYGHWESQLHETEYKPYVGEAVSAIKGWESENASISSTKVKIQRIVASMGQQANVRVTPAVSPYDRKVAIVAKDNRYQDVLRVLNGYTPI